MWTGANPVEGGGEPYAVKVARTVRRKRSGKTRIVSKKVRSPSELVCHPTISVNSKYPENNLNGYFITGFTDAEGSFRVRISQSKERKIGWVVVVEPIFQIGLDQKDLVILQLIQKSFNGAGTITKMGTSNGWMYKVSSIKEFNEIIIPHFTYKIPFNFS